MKQISKKSDLSLIENSARRVTLSFAPIPCPFIYVVTEYSKKINAVVSAKYFNDLSEAENYMFENYVHLIIPTNRFIHEGTYVFLY